MVKTVRRIPVIATVLIIAMSILDVPASAGYMERSEWGNEGTGFNSEKAVDKVSFGNKGELTDKKFGSDADGFSASDVDDVGAFHKARSLTTRMFMQQTRSDNKKYLKKKLDDRGVLSERDKRYLIKCFDKYYDEGEVLRDGEDKESVEIFLKVAHDDSMDLRAKKDALERYFKDKK